MNLDDAKKVFDELMKEWSQTIKNIESEEDTRFQVIDRMLTEVLGWGHNEIKTEKHTISGYVDYLIHSEGRNRFVLEAKRISKLLIDTINPKVGEYKVGGSSLTSAQDGLKQAKKYCIDTGTGFAVLTTGAEWIGFLAIRTDGTPPKEGRAIVFPSLESISEKFAKFYDLFSKEGVINDLYKVIINEAEGLTVKSVQELHTILDRTQIRLLPKNKMASDMDIIFKEFFSTMSGEQDPEMLSECFVVTKESKEADASLEKITRNLVNTVEVLTHGKSSELQQHIQHAVETRIGEFVLIIGNKGAGKTTFIDRFFRLVLDKRLRERCLVLRIDLKESTGDINTITDWLMNKLKYELEHQLFKDGNPTYDELQGVFFQEYIRWSRGVYKFLYDENKTEFKIKFGERIDNLSTNNVQEYVIKLLQHTVLSRKLMPCIIFDNADHYPQKFQESIFQYAQSLFQVILCFVIFPITDRTIWQLSKSGPMQSYETTAFYLPLPSTKDILSKRIDFVKKKLEEEKDTKEKYFLKKGIRLSVDNIKGFAACLEEAFIKTDFIGRIIGWLANHDIRRSLQITRRIVTSPRIRIEDLVTAYIAGSGLQIKERYILGALIAGDYNHFIQEENSFILNMFSINPEFYTSPLIKLSIIVLLHNKDISSSGRELSYMTIEDIMNYCEPIGFSRSAARYYLQIMLQYRLIEPYDPTEENIFEDLRVRITTAGKIHYEFAINDETYVTHMALTTPIRDHSLCSRKRQVFSGGGKLTREDWKSLISDFIRYILDEDKNFVTIPKREMYEMQAILRRDLRSRRVIDE